MIDTFRASELNIIVRCGLAAEPPEKKIDSSGPEANLGQAVHESADTWIKGGMVGEPKAQPHANQWGVDVSQVEALVERIPEAIKEIREDLSGLESEISVEGGLVRGRIDAISVIWAEDKPFSVSILDWKTGRDPQGGKPEQRLGYASAVEAMHGMPHQGYIHTAEIWLATGEILESRHDLDSIQGFRRRLEDRIKYKTANPGSHCRYCNRRFECSERFAYVRSAVSALARVAPGEVSADQVAELWDKSRAVKRAVEAYEKLVDDLLEQHGDLVLPDGRRLVLGTKTRETIDAQLAWPVMRGAGLSNQEINGALTVSKTKLLAAVKNKAPRGEKAKVGADLMTQLDLQGAIARTKSSFKKIINP